MEHKINRCKDDLQAEEDEEWDENNNPTCTVLEMMNVVRQLHGKNVVTEEESTFEFTESIAENDRVSYEDDSIRNHKSNNPELIDEHLQLLAEDPRKFVTRTGSRGGGEWTVNFANLNDLLAQFEIENYVTACYGNSATRIVRILHDKGKLDEKKLGDFALLRPRDLRATLSALQASGIVDVQSVPKDASRQTSKSIFLWFFDQDRCRRLILADVYQSMARLLQRAKFEEKQYQSVLEKAERTDVKGNEDQYLSSGERLALDTWKDIEGKLLAHLWRLDDLVSALSSS